MRAALLADLLLAVLLVGAPACRSAEALGEGESPALETAPPAAERAVRQRPFVGIEYEPFRRPGTGAISGQAFLRTRGGDVKFGAGSLVHLVPVTSYSAEWFEREVLGDEVLAPRDARAEPYHAVVRADGFGEFRFEELPAGEYYLACQVRWEIAGTGGRFRPAGGWAHARVTVRKGRTTRAVLTR